MLTGQDVKRQVMAMLRRPPYEASPKQQAAHAALSPCVVLTEEEAHLVRQALFMPRTFRDEAEALLTPEAGDE